MQKSPNKPTIEIKSSQRQAFREVFEMCAQNNMLDKKGLKKLFEMVDYRLSPENFEEICNFAFGDRQHLTYDEFIRNVFKHKTDYDLTDVKNALRLIAGQSDNQIDTEKLKRSLASHGLSKQDIYETMQMLKPFIASQGTKLDYQALLNSLS